MKVVDELKAVVREGHLGDLVWLVGLYAFIWTITLPFRVPREGLRALHPVPRPLAETEADDRREQEAEG